MPDTMADFEKVLVAFRDKDPNGNGLKDEVPWTTDPRVLLWPFGIGFKGYNNSTDMFVENNVIKFGPTDPRFKDAVTLVARWYKEGLIDPEYLGQSGSQRNALVLGNLTGAILGSYAGYLTAFNKLYVADGHPDWKWVAMPSPAGPTGIRNMMGGHKELDPGCGSSITVASKYPARITEMMDYFYGEEGRRALFFGEEGVHYTMQNGEPVYTDVVAKNPLNLSIAAYMNTYVGYISVWPSLLPDAAQLALYDQEGKDGLRLSAKYETDRKIPNLQFTAEEIKEVQEIARDLDTYTDEWVHGFIRGQKSITADWAAFQAGIKQLKAERLTALYNQAYDRFKKVIGM
jgi:putative aldouronate transport system substrate-binding protein